MFLRSLIIIIMSLAPCLLHAVPTEGADSLCTPADTLSPLSQADNARRRNLLFDDVGLIPKHQQRQEDYWAHVPADCHIDWRRHRERPLIDFCMDIARFFNTYDTTYVERNGYNFRVMATNTDFFQIYRIAGRDDVEGRQMLTFAPDHAIKVGPRVGWRWLNVGYTRGVVPSSGHKTTELNLAAYNSRIGCDINYQHCSGPFHLRRMRGITGLPEYSVKGHDVDGISTNTIAASAYYVFNYRHFSYPAAYNASNVQLRNAGSWMLGVSYDYQRFNFDPAAAEGVIQGVFLQQHPYAEPPRLIDALRVREVNYHRIGIGVGYGYNWVPAPHWLVATSISPSFGFKKQVGVGITKEMIVDNMRNLHVDATFRAAVVYNRQRWFAGLSAVSYLYDYRHRNFDLNNSVTYLKAYVGMQFYKRQRYRRQSDRSRW